MTKIYELDNNKLLEKIIKVNIEHNKNLKFK